jgi:hypothetical protein
MLYPPYSHSPLYKGKIQSPATFFAGKQCWLLPPGKGYNIPGNNAPVILKKKQVKLISHPRLRVRIE